MHNHAILDKPTLELTYFAVGQSISIDGFTFYDIFDRAVNAINQVAREHAKIESSYRLDKIIKDHISDTRSKNGG